MDWGFILSYLITLAPALKYILMLLGSLVVIATIVIPLTKTKVDDEAWAKLKAIPFVGSLIGALEAFALIKKK